MQSTIRHRNLFFLPWTKWNSSSQQRYKSSHHACITYFVKSRYKLNRINFKQSYFESLTVVRCPLRYFKTFLLGCRCMRSGVCSSFRCLLCCFVLKIFSQVGLEPVVDVKAQREVRWYEITWSGVSWLVVWFWKFSVKSRLSGCIHYYWLLFHQSGSDHVIFGNIWSLDCFLSLLESS